MDFLFGFVFVVIVGLLLGSFAGASVWRLRARQLVEDQEAGEKVNKRELAKLKKLTVHTVKDDRSQCLHCGHSLAWYDLLPLVSWTMLRGRCRYCKKPIGWFEPVVEVTTMVFFAVSYAAWPYDGGVTSWILLVVWLIAGLGLTILFWYDAKWSLLPNIVMFPLIGLSAASFAITIYTAASPPEVSLSGLMGCLVLSGLYFVLYIASKGAWVGFGDVKLTLSLALLLADWKLALLTLFLANVIGCIVVVPGMVSKRLSRYSRVPFGPMLILAWVIAGLWGHQIIAWYLQITLISVV